MPTQDNVSMISARTFYPFPLLPAELQHQIWSWAFFAAGPICWWQPNQGSQFLSLRRYCTHSSVATCPNGCRGAFYDTRYFTPGFVSCAGPFGWCLEYFPSAQPPWPPSTQTFEFDSIETKEVLALLGACQDSRKWALKMWREIQHEHTMHDDEYDATARAINTLQNRPSFAQMSSAYSSAEFIELYFFEKRVGVQITDPYFLRALPLKRRVGKEIKSQPIGRPLSGESKKWQKGTIGEKEVVWFVEYND